MAMENHNDFSERILQLIKNRELDKLKEKLAQAEEMEILHIFHDLEPEDLVITFRLLDKERALSVFEQLDLDLQQDLLAYFTEEGAIEYINEMAPDDRVRLLDELPASVAKKLVNSLSAEERETTNLLLGYGDETAGRIMTTEFITLRKEMTVAEALKKVRKQAPDKETVYTLYITDNSKILEGVLSLRELVCAEMTDIIGDIMHVRAISVTTDTDQEEAANTMQDMDLIAMPVVDKEGRMVGIITIDDAMDILKEEATEDILDHAGLADVKGMESDRSEVLIKGSIWKIWRVRLPFLLITLIAAMLAGGIIEFFEETLGAVIAVAFFIPLIMDMGGNVGTQSSTVFARGVVLGHINIKSFMKPFLKEVSIGFSMGVLVGGVAGVVAAVWQGMPALGLAVGISLVATMTIAALLGFLVPFVLIKFNVDQAAGSAPIITSIKDIVGLLVYFLAVTSFMNVY